MRHNCWTNGHAVLNLVAMLNSWNTYLELSQSGSRDLFTIWASNSKINIETREMLTNERALWKLHHMCQRRSIESCWLSPLLQLCHFRWSVYTRNCGAVMRLVAYVNSKMTKATRRSCWITQHLLTLRLL